MFSNKYKLAVCLTTVLLGITPVRAQSVSDSFCGQSDYSFLYFNGVRTTETRARVTLRKIAYAYGPFAPNGKRIFYSLAYNDSSYQEGSVTRVGWNDILETFEQRFAQQPRSIAEKYELFFEALNGGGALSTSISKASPSYQDFLQVISDPIRDRYLSSILYANNRTLTNYAAHESLINKELDNGRALLIYAHSQGNLFANQAYRYALLKVDANSVKTIHIAPASSERYGDYVLADGDLVINVALRKVASLPEANSHIPPYNDRPSGIKLAKENGKDILGHGLLEIYLNKYIVPVESQPFAKSVAYVRSALNNITFQCPLGSVEYSFSNYSGRIFLDGFDYGFFLPSGIDPNYTRSFRVERLKPGKHSIGVVSQSSSGVSQRFSVNTYGKYRLADGSAAASGTIPASGMLTYSFVVPAS